MTPKTNVHFLQSPSNLAALIDELGNDLNFSSGETVPEPGYEVLVAGRPAADQLSPPQLHTLIIPWAGLPDTTRELMLAYPHIAVHNLHHNAQPVAELAFTLLLSATKLIIPLDRALRQNDWRPRYQANPSPLLWGKTALILGYGAIGQQLAPMCQGLGMQVWGTRRTITTPISQNGVTIYPADQLEQLLPQVDALLIALPQTPATTGLIDAHKLSLLPETAVLVNVGRGGVIDQAALYQALTTGQIFAAGIDVWYNYPADTDARAETAPADYPFHELDNVVMSPHRGGACRETEQLRLAGLTQLLRAIAQGESVPNRVDVSQGY